MDDNNKYNRNKDYEPDNFDDEVAFPARRNNAPERSSDIQEDYGDNFDNDVKFVGDYDEDAVQMPEIDFEDDMETPVKMPSERDDRTQTPDYGDNFDSQTGEQVSKARRLGISLWRWLTACVTSFGSFEFTECPSFLSPMSMTSRLSLSRMTRPLYSSFHKSFHEPGVSLMYFVL